MGDVANMADFGNINTRVSEWEAGLPTADDLTPLSQDLISRQLANAFNIKPEPIRTRIDVERASRETFSGLQRSKQTALGENSFKPYGEETNESEDLVMIDDDDDEERSDSRKIRRIEGAEEDDSSSAALRRQRIVWTPQLHKRFVDVVTHLGIKSAVPKTIMQLMNVEGLTRENVASHLQKYRLYLKRMQGTSSEGPSSSDQLFASTPASLNLPIQMPYSAAGMLPVQMFGGHGAMQQRDWSGNSNGSVVSYPHAATAHR